MLLSILSYHYYLPSSASSGEGARKPYQTLTRNQGFMAHLISSVYLSISFAKIRLKCADQPQMYGIGLKCTNRPQMYESASNVQNWPQMYRIGLKCTASNVLCLKCTVPQMYCASNVQIGFKCTDSAHLRHSAFEANLYI